MSWPILRITIERVMFTRAGAAAGCGTARFDARISAGSREEVLGDGRQTFDYRASASHNLGWTTNLNILASPDVTVTFTATDTADTRLSRFQRVVRPPWRQRYLSIMQTDNMCLMWSMQRVEGGGTGRTRDTTVSTAREHRGSVSYTALSGRRASVRIEYCPVTPSPDEDELPPRPANIRTALQANPNDGVLHATNADVRPNSPLNIIANPSVIPLLDDPPRVRPDASDSDLDNASWANERNCARIVHTWYYPRNERFTDNDSRLRWEQLSGTGLVQFIKRNPRDSAGSECCGLNVLVYGTLEGEVVLGVRFHGALVAKYRALVRRPKKLPCRFNILAGPQGPLLDRNRYRPRAGPGDIEKHREVASRYLRQIGITLAPDPDATTTAAGGHTATATRKAGIFTISVPQGETRGITDAVAGNVLRYNYKGWVLNFAYAHSHADPNTLGCAVFWPQSNAGPGGTTVDDGQAPSSSWIRPSGVPVDNDAGTVSIRVVTGRRAGAPNDLHGMIITSQLDPGGTRGVRQHGATIAHEVGHMLCLGHRVEKIDDATLRGQWNAGTLRPGPADAGRIAQLAQGTGKLGAGNGVWCDELWHPAHQNLMHWLSDPDLRQDLDLLQAKVAWQSPLLDHAI